MDALKKFIKILSICFFVQQMCKTINQVILDQIIE